MTSTFKVDWSNLTPEIRESMSNQPDERYVISPFNESNTVSFELCHPNATLPRKAHPTDSGWDVYSVEDVLLTAGVPQVVSTGLRCRLPPNLELQVRSRSGLAAKNGVFVTNSPGTIDNAFTGIIGVILTLIPDPAKSYVTDGGSVVTLQTLSLPKGTRIAQLVPAWVPVVQFVRVDAIDQNTDRGSGGFGSTGK